MSAPTRTANGSCHGGLCRSQVPEGPGPVRSEKEVYVGNFNLVEIALMRVSTLDIAGFVPRPKKRQNVWHFNELGIFSWDSCGVNW